jgi:hypothetical protein
MYRPTCPPSAANRVRPTTTPSGEGAYSRFSILWMASWVRRTSRANAPRTGSAAASSVPEMAVHRRRRSTVCQGGPTGRLSVDGREMTRHT